MNIVFLSDAAKAKSSLARTDRFEFALSCFSIPRIPVEYSRSVKWGLFSKKFSVFDVR